MKKIMRGVLLFGMLGGMILACGNKSDNSRKDSTNSQATKNEKVYRIGVSQIVDHPALNAAKQGFKDALSKNGIKADYDDKIANNEMSNQTLIMQQFSSDKKDLVYAITTPTAQAAKNQVDKSIPVVFASVTDPKSAGLVGISNVTGTSGAAPVEENLKLMKELLPKAKNIGIIYNSSEQNSVSEVNNLKKLAPKYGFNVVDKSVTNGTELVSAANLVVKQADMLYAIQDNTVASYFTAILDIFNKEKKPIFGTNNIYSNTGGFISQGTTDYDIGYRSGEIAAQILKGEKKPNEIPIENVKNLKIEVNKKNMELLGIKIPDNILKNVKFIEKKINKGK
ncbi:ABC transporter substrate-binding protein [Leptotrichia sp. oral taxon 847]|uniref:ABC transporter substrate-binding protein n=1 Tax=Leptotrichia sp. oral taxon 847 TaxID=1785996 RepID=UPI000767E111|nr:ABC transporter substrate-binding protein [Leptotrichia sp. oral taxon 847]AMD95537.1 ABC transporter [Leptotrichia sp. oral taxon 847]